MIDQVIILSNHHLSQQIKIYIRMIIKGELWGQIKIWQTISVYRHSDGQ